MLTTQCRWRRFRVPRVMAELGMDIALRGAVYAGLYRVSQHAGVRVLQGGQVVPLGRIGD